MPYSSLRKYRYEETAVLSFCSAVGRARHGYTEPMTSSPPVDNSGETDYAAKVQTIADKLRDWRGPVVLIAHVDPDGDALGSTLALKRALDALGKETFLPIGAPRFLAFLS